MMKQLKSFYEEMRRCLRETPLFVIYLDGMGYSMYESAADAGKIPQIASAFQVDPVRTVIPPVTHPALATILTGCLPEEHKILNRNCHVPAVPTIFKDWKKNAAYLEGDSVIIRTELPPRLHTKREGLETDEWIFQSVLAEIGKGTYFILAHFHGIDDAAHLYGPYGEKTLEEIERKDEMTGEIVRRFQGQVLLISDHGLHESSESGDHGWNCPEDMTAIWGKRR